MPGDVEVGEETPLLKRDIPLAEMKAESLKERAVAGTAAVSFITSLLSILFEAAAHPSVFVSGILGCVLSPYAAIQQQKLTQVEALQQTNQVFEVEVDQLAAENARLKKTVNELEESVMNLQAMEETLATLQSLEGKSIDELERQLTESKSILAQMNTNVKGELLQNLITVMLAVDADGDLLLADEEIDALIGNLEGIHGVDLKEDLLKKTIIEHGRSLTAVMEVARHLLCAQDIPADQSIFRFIH